MKRKKLLFAFIFVCMFSIITALSSISARAETIIETKKTEVEKYNEQITLSEEAKTVTITGATWKKEPSKKVLYIDVDEEINTIGGVITLTYSDGTTEDVAYANKSEIIDWYHPYRKLPETDEDGCWQDGQKVSVSVSIKGLEQKEWPTYWMVFKTPEILTSEEIEYDIPGEKTYFSYTCNKTGIYGFYSNQSGSITVCDEYGSELISSKQLHSENQTMGCELLKLYGGVNYIIEFHVPDYIGKIMLAMKKEEIDSAVISKKPNKLSYLSGYDHYLCPDGGEVTLYFQSGQSYIIDLDLGIDDLLVNCNLSYQGNYLPTENPFWSQRFEPGSQKVAIEISGIEEKFWPTYTIEVVDEKDWEPCITLEEQEYEIDDNNHYFKFVPEEDGYFALLANGSGSFSILSDYEPYSLEGGVLEKDYESCKAVGSSWMEAGKTYMISISSSSAKRMKLALKKDSLLSAKVTANPEEREYLSGNNFSFDIYGIEITLTFQYAEPQIYGSSKNIHRWGPVSSDPICKHITPVVVDGMEGNYIEEGEWKVSFAVKGLDSDLYPFYILESYGESNLPDAFPITGTEYKVGSVGKYFSFQPVTTGYYGLETKENGSLSQYNGTQLLAWKEWKSYEKKETIKTLMWLEQGKTYIFSITGEEMMTMALVPVTVTSGTLKAKQVWDACSSINSYVYNNVWLELKLENGQSYKVQKEEDWKLCNCILKFEHSISGVYEDGLYAQAGENNLIADCHLASNPSCKIQVLSIEDEADQSITVGVPTPVSIIYSENEGRIPHYKLTVNKTGVYKFSANKMCFTFLYENTNELLATDYGEAGKIEFTYHLEQGKTYIVVCDPYDDTQLLVTRNETGDETEEHIHEFGNWTITKKPTCTDKGVKIRKCTKCYATETENIAPLGHEYEENYTVDEEATSTTNGSKSRHCIRFDECGAKTDITTIPVSDGNVDSEENCEHSWKEAPEKSKSPTCTKSGYTVFVCTKCQEEEQKEIKPLGHKYETKTDKQPTCETAGSKHEECIRCGNKKPAVAIPAIDHSFGEYKVTKQPTALAEGTKTRTCTKCGKAESAEIAKLKPIIALSATKLPLQLKKSTTALKVTKMQTGDKVASFTSSNSKIVTVHKTNGKLTAKKVGKAIISVKLKSGKSAKCIVTVQKTPVKTTKIQVTPSSLKLKKGKKAKLVTVLTPLTSQEKVTYISSDKKVATVSSSGVVTAKKAGKAKITAESGKKKVTCTVTVMMK